MNPYDVLVRPLLSEKSNRERENSNKYTFEIRPDAGKKDVRLAIEKMFDVKVDSVTTAITRGKFKRRGAYISKRPGKAKKAIVTLVGDAKIPLFEDL